MKRVQVTCPRCGLEHEVCELTQKEVETIQEDVYGRDWIWFRCREGCGEVSGFVWVR
jgi:hypothetical protein